MRTEGEGWHRAVEDNLLTPIANEVIVFALRNVGLEWHLGEHFLDLLFIAIRDLLASLYFHC